MYQEFGDDTGVFDFEELSNHMLDQGVQSSPSALHGCLSGLLSAGAPASGEYCLEALAQARDLVLHGELAEQVMQLYAVTGAAMQDEEFDFHPLLPDDETDIADRTEALADWCKGFLAGFAHASVGEDKSAPTLSEDSSDILRDFAAMAEAGVDQEDDEEEAEGSYMELVEYLRFATLNVYMDCGVGERESPGMGS